MENGGLMELTKDWARSVFKSFDWSKRKGTTAISKIGKTNISEKKFQFSYRA